MFGGIRGFGANKNSARQDLGGTGRGIESFCDPRINVHDDFVPARECTRHEADRRGLFLWSRDP